MILQGSLLAGGPLLLLLPTKRIIIRSDVRLEYRDQFLVQQAHLA